MKWKKYTIQTTTEAEDYISAMLAELGAGGVEIENKVPLTKADQADMFIDFLPETEPDDGISFVSFYLESDADSEGFLHEVTQELASLRELINLGEGSITESVTEDVDWINNWKTYFHSFYIGDLLIKPTWEALKEEDKGKCVIEIDPGISFGTGKHETTQLCIRQLQKYIQKESGQTILDVGFGSGILTVAALKLGAASAVGTDIDENCMQSAMENMKVNRLSEELAKFYIGNLTCDSALQETIGAERFDIAVANILADVIIPMAPVIVRHLKTGGRFLTSGIIDFKENEVREAIEAAGMKIDEINRQGEWVSITAIKE